jgi:hypothetical protein
MGIAQTQNSQTPKAISKEYAWVVLDPSRDQDWARFLGQYAVGHPNPLLSVIVRRSSQLESSIAALASMSESGQKAKYSERADVFRSSPDTRHSRAVWLG